MTPTDVLILGRRGLIAAALRERFEETPDTRVRALGAQDLDLLDPQAPEHLEDNVDKDTILIVTSRAPRGADPAQTFEDDVRLATNLARFVVRGQIRRCVYFSSTAVYGDGVTNLRINEETPLAPTTLYGAAKVAAESVLRVAAGQAGVPLLILRPCMIYGPGDKSTAYGPPGFMHSITAEGCVRLFGDGEDRRDYLFLDDLVSLTMELALSDRTGVVNLASGRSVSFVEILDCLRRITGQSFAVKKTPRERASTDQEFDIKALPVFKPVPLEEGLGRTWSSIASRSMVGVAL